MFGRNVADEFLDDNCFPHSRAAEEPDFSAFQKRTNEINDFDSGFQNFRFG